MMLVESFMTQKIGFNNKVLRRLFVEELKKWDHEVTSQTFYEPDVLDWCLQYAKDRMKKH